MTKHFFKPTKEERDTLARVGKKTIKPEERKEREPRPQGGFTPRGS